MAGRDEQKIARARGGRDASSAFAEHVTARKRVPSAADTSPLPSTTTIPSIPYLQPRAWLARVKSPGAPFRSAPALKSATPRNPLTPHDPTTPSGQC
ncbi:hypothetical protein EV122DRAFT_285602 [Schizophyllum commune]|nr:hypothetical protein K525DRAFT_275411 [Schizophyllum commune Loenen D]